jgi:very-short-patch-repair endonuclease
MPVCLECNKHFKLLNSHICRIHKITTAEYKLRHGEDTPFLDQSVKDKQKQNGYSPWSVQDVMKKFCISEEEAKTVVQTKVDNTFGRETSVRCVEYWLKHGFSEEESLLKVSSLQSRSEEYYINLFGDIEGKIKYTDHRNSIASSNSKQSMLDRGLTEDEIRLMRDNLSVDSIMLKYGLEEFDAISLRVDRLKNHSSCWSVDYWVKKGLSICDAQKRITLLQTRDLPYFIAKYGDIDGRCRYSKWVSAATSHSVGKFSSKESEEFFNPFIEYCIINNIDYKKEKYFNVAGKSYYVDLCIEPIKLIIEYDGSAFHADPDNIDMSWVSAKKRLDYTSSLAYDTKKKTDLESIGYTVINVYSKRKNNFNLIEIFERMKNGK